MNKIKSFTFFAEYFKLSNTLKPTNKRDKFIGKILDFYFNDIVPNFEEDSDEEAIWENVSKPIIKYKNNALNGLKGGRPKNESKTENKTQIKTEKETNNISQTENTSKNVIVDVNSNLFDFIESNFSRTLNSIEYEVIKTWKDNELTRYAIKQAVLNQAYSIKYIDTILNTYKAKGITSVVQAQKLDKEFQEKKHKSYKTETLPDWFNKDIQDEILTGEELKELERQLMGGK